MSGMGYKLGLQGHQILNSNNVSTQFSNGDPSFAPKFQVPSELDYLLYDIANPGPSTSVDKIFSYLVHYYPRLKNTQNVNLLTTHFLRCPLFFDSPESMTLQNITKIIECYQYIITTKYKISNPSVTFHEFYSSIYDSVRLLLQHEPTSRWKVIPLLAGCISAITPTRVYNQYPSHSNVISKLDKLVIDLFSDSFLFVERTPLLPATKDSFLTSLLYTQEHLSDSFYSNLSETNPKILAVLMRVLFFSKDGLDKGSLLTSNMPYDEIVKTMPLVRFLNKSAFLYQRIVKNSPHGPQQLSEISDSINFILSFSVNISNSGLDRLYLFSDKWDLVKYIFFTIVMIFEHATEAIVAQKSSLQQPVFVISSQILRSLFCLSYVLDKIGTGGFDSYNFVFDSTTSLLAGFNPKATEGLMYSLLNEIPVTQQQTPVNQSKLNFFLRTTEATLQALSNSFKEATLFPLLKTILTADCYPSLTVEFCYSIIVKHLNLLSAGSSNFASDQEYKKRIQDIVFPCFSQVLSQFPRSLSLDQTSLIIQTCGRAASLSFSTDPEFFNSLLDLIRFQIAISAYTPLPPKTIIMNGNEVVTPERINTRRAGLISLYIDLLQNGDLSTFIETLKDIKQHIDKLNGSEDIYTLYDHLWDTILLINKFDCQKGQVGLDWWYRIVNGGLAPRL